MSRITFAGSVRSIPFLLLLVGLLALPPLGCGGPEPEPIPEAGGESADAMTDAEQEMLESLRAPDPEKIIATVNGVEVAAGKVYEVAALNLMNLQAQGRTLDENEERALRMQVLELIINDELMAQEAERLGLEVTPEEVDARIAELREQHGTEAAFEQVLTDAGLTAEEFRDEVAHRLLSGKLVDHVTRDIRVTEEEARAVYEKMPERYSEGETAEVRQILIQSRGSDPEAKRRAALERAQEAHERALAGESFAELAKEYSQAANAAEGGLVSHFPRGVMVPRFEEVAFGLEVGEISDVFETQYGYNVIQVTDRKEPTRIPFAEVKPKLMVDLAQAKETMAVQMTIRALQQNSDVRVLDPEFLPGGEDEASEARSAEGDAAVPGT